MRYAWLAELAGTAGARHVAVAHTADDQAETILHRLLRGTGVGGLAGMAAARELAEGVALVRPLLGCGGGDVRQFLAQMGQPWREDASNSDVRYARNFLRHRVLPEIVAGPYPAAAAALRRVGVQAGALAGALSSAAGHLLEIHSQRQADGSVILQTGALVRLDQHLLAEIFVTLWRREAWPQRDMTARHYTQLAEMVRTADVPLRAGGSNRRPNPAAYDLPSGIEARTAPGRLSIGPVKRADAAAAGSA
jgi:tRNA(Ile)-lysidine synthase